VSELGALADITPGGNDSFSGFEVLNLSGDPEADLDFSAGLDVSTFGTVDTVSYTDPDDDADNNADKLAFTNLDAGGTLELKSDIEEVDLGLDAAGDATVVLNDTTFSDGGTGLQLTSDFENLTITSNGSANSINNLDETSNDKLNTLTIDGDGDLSVTLGADDYVKIDGSAANGDLTIDASGIDDTVDGTEDGLELIGGSGNDTLTGEAAGSVTGQTIKGNGGNDSLIGGDTDDTLSPDYSPSGHLMYAVSA
jgi:hypothetical protein